MHPKQSTEVKFSLKIPWYHYIMNKDDFEKLQEAYALRGVALHQLHERVASLEDEVIRLKELLRLQQERLFG